MTNVQVPSVAVVVATMGRSQVLERCLQALREQAGFASAPRQESNGKGTSTEKNGDTPVLSNQKVPLEITAVVQGELTEQAVTVVETYADRTLQFPSPMGFAAANNAGLAAVTNAHPQPSYVALVNDDAVVEDQWLNKLVDALETHPTAAAAQGINLLAGLDCQPNAGVGRAFQDPSDSERETIKIEGVEIDGAGIQWRRKRAVQIDRSRPWRFEREEQREGLGVREVFGVSATAALYRTRALLEVALAPPGDGACSEASEVSEPRRVFDPTLHTYYEDVDLACRLRRAGWTAIIEPSAVCDHVASSSAPEHKMRLLVRNRHLVLARHLGRAYLPNLPLLLTQDLNDAGLPALLAWGAALRRAGSYLHWGKPIALSSPEESP